ncbi:MAG: hypothetical protein PF636_10680, partial [Actinomycetota bacterium]|nr:hypothetical protein [Actinomycetota bacterium]
MRTFTRTASDTHRRTRVLATAALAAAMVLMMVVPSYGATTVNLHTPHVGASSTTFNNEADDGGLSAAVVWHFVLNGLDRGTSAAELTVTFAGAGTSVVSARVVGQGQTQHFYVGTSGHDVLAGAYAMVDSEGTGNLVLSHVSYDQVEPPLDEPPVDDPPVDEPPEDYPPVDEP